MSGTQAAAVACIALIWMAPAASAGAQTLHLAPIARRNLSKDEVVLKAQARASGSLDDKTLAIQNGQLVIASKSGNMDVILLANRTIRDVVAELRATQGDAWGTLETKYPFDGTRLLHDTDPTPLSASGSAVEVNANVDAPDVFFAS